MISYFQIGDDSIHFADLESSITGINEDIKSFDARLKFAADIQSVAEVIFAYVKLKYIYFTIML